VDIPHTGESGSNLHFEAFLQEYLQLHYEYFLLVLPLGVTVVNFALQITKEEKTTRLKMG
jgi:hypothetical protein